MTDLTESHYPTAWTLWLEAGWNRAYQIEYHEFVRSWNGSSVRKGIIQSGELLAIGRANTDGTLYAMIYDIVVHPAWRGRGIGRQITQEIVTALQSQGTRVIQLMAAEHQAGFYEALGFERRKDVCPGMQYAGKESA